jgi:3,4-dihydroxy 2-butanone 4-phosphate synthase
MKEDESEDAAARWAESASLRSCPGTFFATQLQSEERFTMSTSNQIEKRIAAACEAMRSGLPIVLLDDNDREDEADLIAAAETLSHDVMVRLIRDCSGIVCLCLDDRLIRQLDLPPMAAKNETRYGTAFTVSIEAKIGIGTGVSASDRLTTVRAAIAEGARPEDLARPGHVFPLRAQPGGVLTRRGHTEGAVDLARLAGLKPAAVLCELMDRKGEMLRGKRARAYARRNGLPVLTIADIAAHLGALDIAA